MINELFDDHGEPDVVVSLSWIFLNLVQVQENQRIFFF